MSTAELLKIVKDRGLEIELLPDGQPVVRDKAAQGGITESLLRVLRRHRDRIISMAQKGQLP